MTPNEGQQLAIESRDRELPDNHWNRVYTDPDYFGEFAKRPAIQTGASLSPFPETYAKRQANIAYLSSSLEIPAEEMPAIYEAKKNEIGKTALQTPTLSDEGLFNYFKKQFDRENEVNTAADGIYQEVQKSVFQGLFDSQAGTDITGQPAYRPLLEQKLTEAGEILSDEDRLRIRENADKMADNLRRANDSIGDEARWLFDIVSKQTGRGQEYELTGEQPNPAGTVGGLGPVMNLAVKQPEAAPAGEVDLNDPEMLNFQTEQVLEKFADMPTERRQSIYLLAGAFAELNQVDKGVFYQAAETLGRFLTREMGERISRNFTEESIRGQQRLLESDLPLYEATNLDGSKGLSQAPAAGQAPITAEQREKLKTDAARKLKILQIKRELVNLADTQIDPIKVVTDWPTWEQGFYGFVGSIPYAGIAAIPFVGFPAITASFFGQYKDDLLLEYPDMDPDQAAAISALAAPMAAGLELIQANLVMGRFVSLDRAIKFFLKPSRNPMTRIIARGTATFGLETGIELSQNRVLPILQTLGAALSDDIPDYDWRKDIEAFDEELGVTAVTMLLFTLTGLPFITSQEIGRNAAYLQDKKMLKYFGMSEEQADRVSTSLTKKERVAAFKEAEAARDPALIEAGRRQLFVDTMAQLQEPADPFQPSIRRDGDRFTVLDAEGNTIADRVDVDTAFYEFERIAGSSETLFASVQGELINALLEAGQATNPEGFSEQIQVATQEVINRYNNMTPEQLQRRIAQWERETGQTWQPGAAVNITAVNTLEQVKEGLFQSITRVVKAKSPEEIRAVLEDRAEGQYKMALQAGQFSEADMVGWIREYESGTGDSLLEEDFTSRDVVEAVSTMSVAYYSGNLDNARVSSRLRAFFEALKEYFAAIFARGIRIKEAIAAGQISPEFEAFLAQSVGLDIDRQIGVQAAQQARAEVNAGGLVESTFAISPFDLVGRNVIAKRNIEDSPLANEDSSAKKGAVGYVEDYDDLAKLLYVDFGKGAIAVDPKEISVATPAPTFAISPQIQTDAFKQWFGDWENDPANASKVVDENGNPLVVYHGTRRPDRVGERFRKSRATSGPMAFFSADPAISSSYAEGKVDTSLDMPSDYAGWFKYKGKGMRSAVDIDRAWWMLSEAERETIRQRIYKVGYENADEGSGPIVGNSSSIMGRDSIDYELRQARGNALRAMVEMWLNSGSLFNDEQMFMQVLEAAGMDMSKVTYESPHAVKSAVYPVYLSIKNPLNTSDIPADVVAALEQAGKRKRAKQPAGRNNDNWDKNTISGKDWLAALTQDIDKGWTHAWTRVPDWVTETLSQLGYDGIRDTGGKFSGKDHQVWIPFRETQVKSATGNRGTFDASNPNITFSISPGKGIRFDEIAQEDPKHDGSRVGTAWQGKVKPTTQDTNDSIATVKPKELEKQMAMVTHFVDGVPLPKYITKFRNAEKRMRAFIDFQKENLLALYDAFEALSSDYVIRSTHWYDGARLLAEGIRDRYGLTIEQSSAIIAVFSPMKDWFQNVAMGQRFADVMANHKDATISKAEMGDAMKIMINAAEDEKGVRAAFKLIEGRSIAELMADKSKAGRKVAGVAIRLMSTHVHGLKHDVLSPEGESLGTRKNLDGTDKTLVWQSYDFIEKAIEVYEDGSAENISKVLGTAHKIRNFYNNIVAPTSPYGDATVDTHAVNAAVLYPMGNRGYLVGLNFGEAGVAGGGNSGLYWLFHEALREAAAERGVMPRQMQSITWEAIRGLFTDVRKRDKNFVAQITKIWESSSDANAARSQIIGLGITPPEWARVGAGDSGIQGSLGEPSGQGVDAAGSVQSGVRQGRQGGTGSTGVESTFAISPASYYGDLESAVAALNSNPAFRRERVAAVLSKFKRIKEQFANKADLEPLSMPEAVAQLEAIITLLPPDAQSEVGGFRRLLSFATAKGRLNYLTDRIAKADAALEKYLRTELQEDIMDLLERAMPRPGENKVQTSSLGPDAQRVANLAIAAIELGTDETSNTMAEIEAALASPDIDADRQEKLLEQWGVLNALGDFFNRSALELDQARVFLRQTFGAGRAMWRMQQEARRKQYRDMAEELAGGLKKATENQIDKMDKENPWLKNPRQFVLSHYSFMQLLRSVLPKAGFLETWERSIRQAEIGSSRYRMDAAKRFIDTLMAASGKKTSFGVGRLMYNMRKTRKAAVRYKEGYNEKLIRLPMETAANILEGRASAKAFKLNAEAVAKMSEAYLAVPIMRRRTTPSGAVRETPNRQQFLEFYVRQSEGTDDKLNMSPAEAMQLLLAWDQSEVQARMRRQGWTDESIEDMQKMVTSVPGGEATMDFLRREYKAGGDAADPVYMKMFGMAMPRIENYAPTRYRHKDDSNDLSPMGSALELAGTTPGSLKARQRHDARMRRTDAITVFFQHAAQMGHWIHFAEINREIRGVLKNQNVRESMEATLGRSGLQIFDQWMDTLAQGGGRRAMELSADKDIWAALISGKSIASLGFSVRTLFMQIDAANRAALDMGLAEYTKTVLDPRWMADMPKAWNSDTVQRRLIEGSRPEVRYVFERAAVRPSMLLWAAQKSMIPMQMTDAALTSFTAAIVYRNAYNKAKKAEASDAMAEQAALDAMDKAVFNYSQPIDITSRSLREVQGNMLQKVYMMFLSDARLKTALFAEAIGQLGKEGERGKGASTISALMIMAVVTQTMANLYRDWFSDEPDDEIWTLEGYAMAMMLAPLSGYMLVGTVGSTVVREAFGEMTFQSTDPANEMIDRGIRSIKGWDNTFNTSDPEAMLKQWNNLLRFASFNPTLAAPAALLNFAKPIMGAMENAENPE
jgi:hypothetical protein